MVICKYCGITETSYYKLKKHIAKDHAETESKIQCDKCMKELSSKHSLKNHIKTCDGLSSLQCQYCYKSLSNAYSKYRHQKTCKSKHQTTENTREINKTNVIGETNTINNNLILIYDRDKIITAEKLPNVVEYVTKYINNVCNNKYRLYVFTLYSLDKPMYNLVYDELYEKRDNEKKLHIWGSNKESTKLRETF